MIKKLLNKVLLIRVIKKLSQILTNHQKIRIVQLVFLMLIGGILETLPVSLIYPFMNMVMSPDEMMDKWYIVKLCELFHIESYRVFLIFMAVVMALLYIVKNIYLLMEYNVQYRFVFNNQFAMQKKILDVLIHRPYEYFLNISSGEIIRIITSDTGMAFNALMNLLATFTELIVAIMLIITMLISAPAVTICIALVLIVMLVLISGVIKPIMEKAGKTSQYANAGLNKWLLQSIQGIKEIKVSSTEDFFEKNYDEFGQKHIASSRIHMVCQNVPRFFLEAVSMGTMFIVVAVMLYRGSSFEVIIPMLSIVAMAAIRILPSVNRMSNTIAQVAYAEPMVDKFIENIGDIGTSTAVNPIDVDKIGRDTEVVGSKSFLKLAKTIRLNKISYKYPESEKYVLDNAEMSIKKGESVGIVGSTGAGKTTAVDLILGLLNPTSGTIEIDGVDIKNDIKAWLSQVGYIPQAIFMLDGSIKENVAFGVPKDAISEEDVWRALEEAALADFVRSLPDGLNTEIGERGVRLSGGQRQRIGIARALYSNPAVLILDEATSALDNETENAIMDSINGLHGSKTMIIIAHRLTTIEGCDHVYRVENGKIRLER